MKRSLIALFVMTTLGLVGCGKAGTSDPVAKMKGYRDQMCACAKTAQPVGCIPKINVGKKQWEEGLKEGALTPAQQTEFDAADKEFSACRDAANAK